MLSGLAEKKENINISRNTSLIIYVIILNLSLVGSGFFKFSDIDILGGRYINDYSTELYELYSLIKQRDNDFLEELHAIDNNIRLMTEYANNNIYYFTEACIRANDFLPYEEQIITIINNSFVDDYRLYQHLNV